MGAIDHLTRSTICLALPRSGQTINQPHTVHQLRDETKPPFSRPCSLNPHPSPHPQTKPGLHLARPRGGVLPDSRHDVRGPERPQDSARPLRDRAAPQVGQRGGDAAGGLQGGAGLGWRSVRFSWVSVGVRLGVGRRPDFSGRLAPKRVMILTLDSPPPLNPPGPGAAHVAAPAPPAPV